VTYLLTLPRIPRVSELRVITDLRTQYVGLEVLTAAGYEECYFLGVILLYSRRLIFLRKY
jgi:hypothetical protein